MVEERTGKRIHEMFDLICGTSTGAIIAALITTTQYTTDAMHTIYSECADQVFSKYSRRKIWTILNNDDKGVYPTKSYEELIKRYVGDSVLFHSDFPDPKNKLFMISAEQTHGKYETVLFRNYQTTYTDRGSDFKDVKLYEAIRGTSAAPFYFDALYLKGFKFVDGGCVANNPTHQAIMEARILYGQDVELNVLSLGTGTLNDPFRMEQNLDDMMDQHLEDQHSKSLGEKRGTDVSHPHHKKKKKGWSSIARLISVATDSDRIAKDVEKYIASSCRPGQIEYFRFSPPGLGEADLATVDPQLLHRFTEETRKYIMEVEFNRFNRMCECIISALEEDEQQQ
jgi:predicted acylesterase/phospholipase RssA